MNNKSLKILSLHLLSSMMRICLKSLLDAIDKKDSIEIEIRHRQVALIQTALVFKRKENSQNTLL
jgi:hypothetical protein